MNTFLYIIKKEIKETIREKLIFILALTLVFLLSISLYFGWAANKQKKLVTEQAQLQKQEEWVQQGDKHPHIAAHYGTYIFKPNSAFSLFDPGLNNFTGTSVYLEAHYRHEFMFRPAQDHSSMIRFGELSPVLVLQILLPLLIIFLSFNAFTKEREQETLKLLVAQGIPIQKIIWGKVFAYLAIILTVLSPFLIIAVNYALSNSIQANISDLTSRLVIIVFLYLLYTVLFLGFSVLVSLKASNSRNSILILLSLWFLFTVIIPKAASNIGESLFPHPSMKEYQAAVQLDIERGLNEDGTRSERTERLKQEILKEYDAKRVQDLPFNFEGISIQANEEYGSKVSNDHREKLEEIFHKQNRVATYASIINPYLAIRNLSMALSSTDLHAFIHFQENVIEYRIQLIKVMNDDMAFNSNYGEFFEYKAGQDLWESVPPFTYSPLTLWKALAPYKFELVMIISWCLALLFFLQHSSKKMRVIHE